MHIYLPGRSASSGRQSQPSDRRRQYLAAWDVIHDAIERERQIVAGLNPRSPRVKPTLALAIGLVLR